MKKLLLLSILGTIGATYFAQSYTPFPTSNASWIEVIYCQEKHYSLVGDTLVNNKTYHQLYVNDKIYTQNATGCPMGSGSTIYGSYAGAYRNDSINKRVYFLPPNLQSDTLLYDFNYSIGDTLKSTYKPIDTTSGIAYTLIRIDSIFTAGKTRNRYTFYDCSTPSSPSIDTLRFIEGIGSNQSLLGYSHACNSFGYDMQYIDCFREGPTASFSTLSSQGCSTPLITDVESIQFTENLLSISPNPTNGKLRINSSLEIKRIELYNLSGSQIRDIRVDKSIPEESVIFLPQAAGIYFLRIVTQDGSTYSEKIVKQ
jgi:hypothetical protein